MTAKYSGQTATLTCVTAATGTCTLDSAEVRSSTKTGLVFRVQTLSLTGATYAIASNHDPGRSITVLKP